jgi:glycosyltransferase involved in cell wall biosynthesis
MLEQSLSPPSQGVAVVPRILVVTTIDRTLAVHVSPFLCLLEEMGVDLELGCRSTSEAQVRKLDDLGVPRHEIAFSRNPLHPANIKALWQLKGILERGQFDVADVHTPVAAWVTRLAVHLFSRQTKVIYTCHGFHFHAAGHPLQNLLFLALEKLAGTWTDYLVVINREDQAAALRYDLVPPERVRYMAGTGMNTSLFDRSRVDEAEVGRTRQALGLAEGDVLFLVIAEFTPRKRHVDVLHALARLGDSRVHVAFAGAGGLMNQVQVTAATLGIDSQTHFLGYRQDVPTLIRASLATLLTSEAEGVPKSVMESLALEVPAIGTDVRGTRELLEDGCGILVPLGDVQALAEAMRWMITHPGEAAAMGRRGRCRMQGRYELRNALEAQEAVYREALAGNRETGADEI